MDLIKIGKYIASKRKALGLTQVQLAEKLGMSDKSVSKWERGICLPDVSVYMELCQILGISLNEFIAGEDLQQENVIAQSEENLLRITKDGQLKKRRLWILIGVLTCLLAAAVGIFLFHWLRAGAITWNWWTETALRVKWLRSWPERTEPICINIIWTSRLPR